MKEFESETIVDLRIDGYSFELSARGRGMLFDRRSGEIFSLNRTAAFIFSCLKTPLTYGALIEHFAREFGLSVEAADEDVGEFLREAQEAGFFAES